MLTINSVAVAPMPPQAPTLRPQQPVTPVKISNAVSAENQGVPAAAAQAGQGLGVQALYAPSSLPPVAPTSEAPKVEPQKNAAAPEKVGLAMASTVGLARSPVAEAALALAASRTNGNAGRVDQAESNGAVNGAAGGAANAAAAADNPEQLNPAVQEEQARRAQEAQAERGAAQANARVEQRQAQADAPPLVNVKDPFMEALDAQIKDLLPNMWKASRAAVDVLIGEEAMAAAAARAEALGGGPTERALEATETYVQTSTGATSSTGAAVDRLV